jgi:hypothetical protein
MFKMMGGTWWTFVFDMRDWGVGVSFMYMHLRDWRFDIRLGPVMFTLYQCELPPAVYF